MEKKLQKTVLRLTLTLALPFFAMVAAQAQELKSLLDAAAARNQEARRSQARINEVVSETRDLVAQFKAANKELEGLLVYNKLLDRQVADQNREMSDLRNSIEQVTVIERQIMPLMLRMIDALDQFISADVPFLTEEREKRIGFLRAMLERADVSVPEKFRRLLEAFQIENDYGRTIEAYRGLLEIEGNNREVDFLRIGRVILLYMTLDGTQVGAWDQSKREWTSLPNTYRNQVRQGLRIARKQIAPNLLLLPVLAPEDVQ